MPGTSSPGFALARHRGGDGLVPSSHSNQMRRLYSCNTSEVFSEAAAILAPSFHLSPHANGNGLCTLPSERLLDAVSHWLPPICCRLLVPSRYNSMLPLTICAANTTISSQTGSSNEKVAPAYWRWPLLFGSRCLDRFRLPRVLFSRFRYGHSLLHWTPLACSAPGSRFAGSPVSLGCPIVHWPGGCRSASVFELPCAWPSNDSHVWHSAKLAQAFLAHFKAMMVALVG